MTKLVLPSFYTDKELNKRKGEFFDDSDYKELDYDVDCEDEQGNFICKIRKGKLPTDVIKNYDNLYFNVQYNRGLSAGKVDKEAVGKYYENFIMVNDYKWKSRRKKDGVISKYVLGNPVRSNIVGYFDYIQYQKNEAGEKKGIRSIKITENTKEKSLDELEKLTKFMDSEYKQLMPEVYNDTKRKLVEMGFKEFLYEDCMTTTITVNTDFRTGLHKDANNHNKVGMMAVCGGDEWTGGELLLPKYKVKCCLRQGDYIIFNSDTHHTNNEIKGKGRYSFVFYIRDNIVRFYDKDDTRKIVRSYTDDLFLDYTKRAIVLEGTKYNKHKEEIIKYAKKQELNIYRMSKNTSFNSRKFGNGKVRYINQKNRDKFTNPVLLSDIIRSIPKKGKEIKEILKRTKKIRTCRNMEMEFYVRSNTTDWKAVEEVVENRDYQNKNINFDIEEDDVVLDLGVNIGAFSVLAINKKCKKVIGYECEKSNFNLAIKNVLHQKGDTEINLYNRGVSKKEQDISLFLCSTEYNNYRHSIMIHKTTMKRKSVLVHCDSMRKVIHQNPDITFIKMDIEGAEMDILESIDEWYNPNIKKLAFEWSFDFDDSVMRFNKMKEGLSKYFSVIHHRKLGDLEHYTHYPQCLLVLCKVI